MKILIFIHSLSAGGAERVASSLANHWAEKGWEITIVTMTGREKDFYELHPAINRIALHADAESANILEAVWHNLRRVHALRTVLKWEKPDVALGMMTTANCLLALAASETGIPAIGSEHIHPPAFPLGRAWSWLRERTYPRLAAVTALTRESAAWLQIHTGATKVPVIPNSVTYPMVCKEPCVRPEQILTTVYNSNILLAVGRLSPQKGFDRLLAAFAELAPRFPDWCLVIVGEGNCRSALEQQVSKLGLEKRVFLPGVVGNIGEWYEAADLYVMTSRFEGFGNTLVEALAHGLPAVSVDCDTGPRDILRHEIDGLLVPQDDHASLVEALARLMSDKRLRHCYAARAVEARKRFSLEKISSQWEQLFREVVE